MRSLEEDVEFYQREVKDASDLIRLGIIPKPSPQYIAVISAERLKALRDILNEAVTQESLGTWQAAVVKTGVSRAASGESLNAYALADWVIPDKLEYMANRVRFTKEYAGKVLAETRDRSLRTAIKAGELGRLLEVQQLSGRTYLQVKLDNKIEDGKDTFSFPIDEMQSFLEASTVASQDPVSKPVFVRENAFRNFFPNMRLKGAFAEEVVMNLLAGHDFMIYGPTGQGKSGIAKDVAAIWRQQHVLFAVEGCGVQCSPFSLIDEKYAKIVPPCPDCMAKADGNFLKSGHFRMRDPRSVKVTIVVPGKGHGEESIEGTEGYMRTDSAGYSLPLLDKAKIDAGIQSTDPSQYIRGLLSRTHNGVTIIDDSSELRRQVMDMFRWALNDNEIKPEGQRYPWPSNSLIMFTSNSAEMSAPMKDRLYIIHNPLPKGNDATDIIYAGLRRTHHKDDAEIPEAEIQSRMGDTQKMPNDILKRIPMPVPLEKAVIETALAFIANKEKGFTDNSGSKRVIYNAWDDARSKWLMDSLFDSNAPAYPNAKYAVAGLVSQLKSRAQNGDGPDEQVMKSIEDRIPELFYGKAGEGGFAGKLAGEEKKWWCEVLSEIGAERTRMKKQGAAGLRNLTDIRTEMAEYTRDMEKAVANFRDMYLLRTGKAPDSARNVETTAPFMAQLWKQQGTEFSMLDPRSESNLKMIVGVLGYYIDSYSRFMRGELNAR